MQDLNLQNSHMRSQHADFFLMRDLTREAESRLIMHITARSQQDPSCLSRDLTCIFHGDKYTVLGIPVEIITFAADMDSNNAWKLLQSLSR